MYTINLAKLPGSQLLSLSAESNLLSFKVLMNRYRELSLGYSLDLESGLHILKSQFVTLCTIGALPTIMFDWVNRCLSGLSMEQESMPLL